MIEQELTWKQKLFCKHYIANDFKSGRAALAAGYSKRSANEIASENLKKPQIRKYIEELMQDANEKLDITIEWKMKKLKFAVDRSIKDEDNPPSEGYSVKDGLNAISELNDMQGHYPKETTSSGITTSVVELPSNNREKPDDDDSSE